MWKRPALFRLGLSKSWIHSTNALAASRPAHPNPISRHLILGGAFMFGTFTVCAVLERKRAPVIHSSRIWEKYPRHWDKKETQDLIEVERFPLFDRLVKRASNISESSKTIGAISALNFAVFLLWKSKAPSIQRLLENLFVSRPKSRLFLPHLLSGFSHNSASHLAFNMMALWSFGTVVCDAYGSEQFCFVYTSSLIMSSLFSHAFSNKIGRIKPSLGASGGILALVSMFTFMHPNHEIMLIFLPFFSFPAWAGVAGLAAFDSLGVILGWRVFDHAAHLGGLAFGYLYSLKLQQYTWGCRRKLTDGLGVHPPRNSRS
uniref:Peptidase S54 rhomboid domain-containing protein n=1 Tax=Spongospora subterranea TaxID=70186 RepID=A0A0H5QN24_9EUKA|eukprot:CRZ02947.1 hypothetical protein [Spongospora subterranea]